MQYGDVMLGYHLNVKEPRREQPPVALTRNDILLENVFCGTNSLYVRLHLDHSFTNVVTVR